MAREMGEVVDSRNETSLIEKRIAPKLLAHAHRCAALISGRYSRS